MTADDLRSVAEMLRLKAQTQPEQRAYTFLTDGEIEGEFTTYGELDQRSRAIAAMVQRRHRPGERALLLYPPGLEFIAAFFGCLYAGMVAVPAHPPPLPRPGRPQRGPSRLGKIAGDALPAIVLATEEIVDRAPQIVGSVPELAAAHWIPTDRAAPGEAAHWEEPATEHNTLAFLQYTSGSTAAPKGVMVSHGNLLHNLAYLHHMEQNDGDSVGVSWLPVYHDMGLIEAILLPTYGGYPAYLMAPAAFLQKPLRWLQAITRYRGTNSGGPNFAFDLCVRKITLEGRGELNLESWRVAYNGAEPIRWQTLEQFHRAFRDSGLQWRAFYPVYGLAEATLLVSSGGRDADPRAVSLGTEGLSEDRAVAPSAGDDASVQVPVCGPCSFETRVVIADPETCRPCAPGTVGEIWVQSPSVAQGYWNRPEATRATFQARLAGEEQSPFLRTGDLGFLDHGELVVTGRINDRIIVRGKKHYPQDIELTVESCSEAIRKGCVAAFGVDSPDGEAVCIAAELSRSAFRTPEAFGALLDTIRCAVTGHHEIPVQAVVLLAPGRIPKTSSGKLRRHDCRAMLGVRSGTAPTGAALEPVARWDRDVTAQRQIAC